MANNVEIIIKATDNASSTMRAFSSNAEGLGSKLEVVGARLQSAFAPVEQFLKGAVDQATTFDGAMTNVGAVLGKNSTEMESLRQQILAMGSDSIYGPQATADAFYDIVGGVADASTHMSILQSAIDTATAGNASLTGTTSALIAVMNSYGFSAEEAGFASDVLTQTVAKGVGTMDEFASALPAVTGLANSMGIEFDTVAGSLAYLTTQGFSASNSATLLKSMMTTLQNPTTELAAKIEELGYASGQALIDGEGLSGAYAALAEVNGGSLAGLVTNVEALQGATALIDPNAFTFLDGFSETVTGATDAAKNIQLDSAASQFAELDSKMQMLNITVGTVLLPALVQVAEAVTPIIQSVADWVNQNPQLAGGVLMVVGAVAVLGPILSTVGAAITGITTLFSLLSTGAAVLTPILGLFGGASNIAALGTTALSVASGALATGLGILLSPAVLIAAAIAAIIYAADKLYPGGISKMFNDARIAATQLAILGLGALVAFADSVKQAFEDAIGVIQGAIEKVGEFFAAINPLTKEGQSTGAFGAAFGDGGLEGKALGGPVTGGTPYLIGEQGPELFVPRTSGTIVPNNELGTATGGRNYNVTLNVSSPLMSDPDMMNKAQQFGELVGNELARRGG